MDDSTVMIVSLPLVVGIYYLVKWIKSKDENRPVFRKRFFISFVLYILLAAIFMPDEEVKDSSTSDTAATQQTGEKNESMLSKLFSASEEKRPLTAEEIQIAEAKAEEEAKRKAAEEAENIRTGWHCLSRWDGSHPQILRTVQRQMREPKSFEHIETIATAVNEDGMHKFIMRYRSRNGFGGMSVGYVKGEFSNANCEYYVITETG